jgi:hypothetical protein
MNLPLMQPEWNQFWQVFGMWQNVAKIFLFISFVRCTTSIGLKLNMFLDFTGGNGLKMPVGSGKLTFHFRVSIDTHNDGTVADNQSPPIT